MHRLQPASAYFKTGKDYMIPNSSFQKTTNGHLSYLILSPDRPQIVRSAQHLLKVSLHPHSQSYPLKQLNTLLLPSHCLAYQQTALTDSRKLSAYELPD
jgi:hypothetical protein